jgi:ABC-type uncharacterized transport system permease subunit
MYLLQVFSLQRRHLRGIFSFLPSVVDLDLISLRLLGAGVTLMTAAIAVGYVYFAQDHARVPLIKIAVTVVVWSAYCLALVLRLRGILITKRLAWACTALFVVALLSLGLIGAIRKTPPATPTVSQP